MPRLGREMSAGVSYTAWLRGVPFSFPWFPRGDRMATMGWENTGYMCLSFFFVAIWHGLTTNGPGMSQFSSTPCDGFNITPLGDGNMIPSVSAFVLYGRELALF